MKILIISKCPTHPTTAGNRWAILAQAEALRQLGNDIHFLYVQELPMRRDMKPYKEDYDFTRAYWGDKFHCFTVSKADKFRMNIMKFVDERTRDNYHSVDEVYPRGLSLFVQKLQDKYNFDICIVNYIWLSRLFKDVKFNKTAIHTHDAMAYKKLKVGRDCRSITAHEEAKALQRSKNLFALQDDEAAYFSILSPQSNIYTIYSIYSHHPQPITGNRNIVFLSGNNEYNQNGIRWFVNVVWPEIHQRFEDVKLLIGGSICRHVGDLANIDGIELQGFIENPPDFYAQGDVAINPIYQGTGLKIKTFEALSYDKITLVHPHSMVGIFQKDKAPLFSSSKPKAWVEYLEEVWDNPDFLTKLKKQNKKYMTEMNEFIIREYKRFLEN